MKYLMSGAAVLTILASPAIVSAQSADPANTHAPMTGQDMAPTHTADTPTGAPFKMAPEQQSVYATWPAEQQADYNAWDADTQSYYWSLNQQQQTGYWALTPDQRGMIYKMSPDQRAKAWQSIAAQMNGQTPPTPEGQANPPGLGTPTSGVPAPQTAQQSVPPAMPQDPGYQGGPYKGALTPPPATAMNKDYPVCSRTVKDSCRNRGGV